MTHAFGMCGIDGNRQLPPQEGRRVMYPQPPFWADLAPTLRQKIAASTPATLFLALLTTAPNADGLGEVELVVEGYRRVPFPWVHMNGSYDVNPHPLSIVLPQPSGAVTHVGLYDDLGELRFYGRILFMRHDWTPAREFDFLDHKVRMKRIRQ
ncbi:MAG: hypothetical protein EPO51_08375 [Phenylobacterium sp.]|uniref:hypothetical protein n=1 Tax=Phenylobacterium sp. TaxID=1871053 RepID=UPI001208B6AD|nr:hypothetical protein [Phenylobacterium sp.]TAJ72122.1 MAG: hypothetical protein EPO51_08375 [Phenylobacterium sp.]